MLKWIVKLAPYGNNYEPIRVIKAQALADFITKCSIPNEPHETGSKAWMPYIDWLVINVGSGAGLIMMSPNGHLHEHALKFMFKTSNNNAEYKALMVGMEICNALGVRYLKAFCNSQLVLSQVRGEYEAHHPIMVGYLAKVKERSSMFKKFKIEYVPTSKNRQADALSKLASSSSDGNPKSIH